MFGFLMIAVLLSLGFGAFRRPFYRGWGYPHMWGYRRPPMGGPGGPHGPGGPGMGGPGMGGGPRR